MPRYQSQLRLCVFQQIQMLPHQRHFNARQIHLPESRSPPVKGSKPPTFPQQTHQLPHQSILTSPFHPFLLMPWLKDPMSLGLGGSCCHTVRPKAPLVPLLGGLPGKATLSRMATSTCNNTGDGCIPPQNSTGHDLRHDNAGGMGHNDLRDNNVPGQDAAGHNFIPNVTTATFH